LFASVACFVLKAKKRVFAKNIIDVISINGSNDMAKNSLFKNRGCAIHPLTQDTMKRQGEFGQVFNIVKDVGTVRPSHVIVQFVANIGGFQFNKIDPHKFDKKITISVIFGTPDFNNMAKEP
jgi:hypothetical protein